MVKLMSITILLSFSLVVSSLFELVYQYDSSTLLIVLEVNDIRAVEKTNRFFKSTYP